VCRRGEQELYPLTRKTISAAAVLEEYVFFARRERNLTRVRLAEYLGVQPAVVYKALSRARQNGLLVDV
jgi:CRP-like cAMP-binding protein